MNKAFTLIELLGVIVILSIIALIVTPLISNIINAGKENLNEAQINSVQRSAKNYVTENLYNIEKKCDTYTPKTGNNFECLLTLKTLKNAGFLEDSSVKNITNDSAYSENAKIKVTYNSGKFTYTFPA